MDNQLQNIQIRTLFKDVLLSYDDVMERLRLEKSAAYKIMHQIPHQKARGLGLRVWLSDLDEWLNNQPLLPPDEGE